MRLQIGEKMKGLATNVQEGVKSSSISLAALTVKIFTGLFLGITTALIAQQLMDYGTVSLIFVTIVVMAIVIRISKSWTLWQSLIFALICVLGGQLLRMYILLAP